MHPLAIEVIDPVQRFRDIVAELQGRAGWSIDDAWLRFAAQAAALRPAAPAATAGAIAATVRDLRAKAPWSHRFGDAHAYVVAALLVAAGDTVDGFLQDIGATGPLLHANGFAAVGSPEVATILALRLLSDGRETRASAVARTRAIYALLRTHHWWLTSRHALPGCALLADRRGSPAEVESIAEGIFQALRASGVDSGRALQNASLMLAMGDGGVDAIVARHRALVAAFAAQRQALPTYDIAAVAQLAWLDHEPARIAERFAELIDETRAALPLLAAPVAEAITADLVFIDLVRKDRRLRSVTEEADVERMRMLLRRQRVASLITSEVPADAVMLPVEWPLLGTLP